MSLHHAAQHLAAHGRGPDTTLVHMTPGEVHGLQTIAKAHGGSLTINPHTGLPEAGFLSSILPTIAGIGLSMIPGVGPLAAAGIVGGLQTVRTGSLQKGLMAGLGAYGGAGLGQGLATAGNSAISNAASAANPSFVGPMPGAASGFEAAKSGVSALTTPAGRSAFMSGVGGSSGLLKAGLAAAAPALTETTKQPEIKTDNTPADRMEYNVGRPTDAQGQIVTPMPDVPSIESGMGVNFGRQQNYFPYSGFKIPVPGQKRFAEGGMPVERMSQANAVGMNTGYPQADVTGHAYATPWQTPVSQNVVAGTADTGVNRMNGQMLAGGGVTGEGHLDLHIPLDLDGGGVGGGTYGSAGGAFANYSNTARPAKTGFSGYNNAAPTAQTPTGVTPINDSTYGDTFIGTGAFGGTPQASIQNMLGVLGGKPMARGGVTRYANGGGISDAYYNLGGYSDGGRLLRGPGDGVSDSIPAVIGQKRPARLADGEFVVPARIVSELGNGSTEAGARKLYAMMDRVQKARKKTVGKGKVAHNSRADKFLPA